MTTRSGARRRTPALLLAFTAAAGSGQPLPIGDEFAVDENTTGTQNSDVVEAAVESDGAPETAAPIHQVIALPQISPAIDVDDEAVVDSDEERAELLAALCD